MWIHLNFYFKREWQNKKVIKSLHKSALNRDGEYRDLMLYLTELTKKLENHIKRFFFLFENTPHLFLALELKEDVYIDRIIEIAVSVNLPCFLRTEGLSETHDEGNKEYALDFFCAGSRLALASITPDYNAEYSKNGIVKLFHCVCNPLFLTWDNEIKCYFVCLLSRGVKLRSSLNFVLRVILLKIIKKVSSAIFRVSSEAQQDRILKALYNFDPKI